MLSSLRPATRALGARAFSTTPSLDLARLTLIGRLVQPPRMMETKLGKSVSFYRIAVNSSRANPEEGGDRIQETFYHDIAAYGKASEYLANYSVGDLIHVEADHRIVQDKDDSGAYITKVYNTHVGSHRLLKSNKQTETA